MKMPENAVSFTGIVQLTLASAQRMGDRELREWFDGDLGWIKENLTQMQRCGLLWLHTEGSKNDCPFTGYSLNVYKDKDGNELPCHVAHLVETCEPALFVKFGNDFISEVGFKNKEKAREWLKEHPLIDWVEGWTFRFKNDLADRMVVDVNGKAPA